MVLRKLHRPHEGRFRCTCDASVLKVEVELVGAGAACMHQTLDFGCWMQGIVGLGQDCRCWGIAGMIVRSLGSVMKKISTIHN